MRRLLLFFSIIVTFLALSGYYLGHRILTGSPDLSRHPEGVWIGIAGFLALVLIGPLLSRLLPENLSGRFYPLRWIINMMMAVFFALLFYTFTVDAVILILSAVLPGHLTSIFQEWSLPFIAALVVGTLLIGSVQALSPKIYRVVVPIADLPTAFDGFKIAQISDLHIGEMIGRDYINKVIAKTNALQPNIIAMTGDIIDGSPLLTAPIASELSKLEASEGVFYVSGNHEYYWGIQNALQQIAKTGAKILNNENVLIHRGDSKIAIAGVPDISTNGGKHRGSDPIAAVANVPMGIVKILLAHQPVSYRQAHEAGVQLQLSGHTHGGQFFPWSLVVRLFQRYNRGLIRHRNLWIYVNRGTATWGPRLRFGIPPEITLLTLAARG